MTKAKHPPVLWTVALVAVLCVCSPRAIAQGPTSPVHVEGTLNLSSDWYSSQGIDERQPHSTYRAILAPTIVLFDQIRLPFQLYVTSDDRGVVQPFNQFGVNPQFWGWITLHAGYYSARISDLTIGDSRILGGGVELTPGPFKFSFLYGRIQQSAAADSTSGFRGAYQRWAWAAKVGYGEESSLHLHLNLMRAWDDSSSLKSPFPDITPMENLVASLQLGIPIWGRAVFLSGEVAAAALSNDTRSPVLDGAPSALLNIFTPRQSSQVDGAAKASLTIMPSPTWSLMFAGQWVGPGFVTLGYAQLPNDVLQGTVTPMVRLFNNALLLRGSIGLQFNNLRSTRIATTQRTIGSATVSIQPSTDWGLDMQYSNYGMQSNPTNDTLRIDNISQSLSISPRYSFPAFGASSTAVLSYSLQTFTDFNTVTGALSNNRTNAGVGSWIMAWPSTLRLSTTAMYTICSTALIQTIVKTGSETIGYSFFNNTLTANLTGAYTIVVTNGDDGQFSARIGFSYTPGKWGTFTLGFATSQYIYDPNSGSSSYREHTGNFQYSYAF